jgi:hypothetical protein
LVNTGERLIRTSDKIASAAGSANAAVASEQANPDTLADFPTRDAFSERVNSPDDFMTGHARVRDARHQAIHGD